MGGSRWSGEKEHDKHADVESGQQRPGSSSEVNECEHIRRKHV